MKYTGYFVKNKECGFGLEIYKDGSEYEGNWKNNKKKGTGTLILANGTKY